VNDSLGHAAGDALLRAVAQRMTACQSGDETLARVGADEFLLIAPAVANGVDGCLERARALQAELAEPFTVSGVELHVTATIGVALAAPGDMGAGLLLKRADMAITRAKQDREPIALYASDDADRRHVLSLTTRLRRALEREELELHYQPIHSVDGELAGLDALLRWRPDGGDLVPPGDFIPLAETSGLIEPIGEWVIHETGRQIHAWREGGLNPPTVSVNVSPRQLRRTDVPRVTAAALLAHQIEPGALAIELTESAIQHGSRRLEDELRRLRGLGVRLAIDDFGADYSSLARLTDLPFHLLKIDRAFVRRVPDDARAGRLLDAIVRLAQALELLTCVEGIEDDAQLDFVRRAGADMVQGFLFDRPLPADRVAAQLPSAAGARATTAIRSRKSGAQSRSAAPTADAAPTSADASGRE
jgi:diguanylate cyclase (GGDEF)-like protein